MTIENATTSSFELTARRWSLWAAGAGLLACAIGWIFEPSIFYRCYLVSYLFWTGLSLGCMSLVMLHHMTGGNWGVCIRRFAETGAMTLPLMLLLFIPIAIGMRYLYPWARLDDVAHDAVLRHKRPYLNEPFFLLRTLIYFAIWISMSWRLWSGSLRYARTRDARLPQSLHSLSALGLVVYFGTMSLATVDWLMSREPRWYSTVMGFQLICAQSVTATSALIILLILHRDKPPFRDFLQKEYFNDLGNLLLTVVILWSYMTFVQFLICYVGNKQDEITWYLPRLNNGWWGIGVVLAVFHFLVPFFTLMIRDAKRNTRLMLWLCSALLLLRVLDNFFMVAPSGLGTNPLLHQTVSWMDFILPIGMGGMWLTAFMWLLGDKPRMIDPSPIPAGVEAHGV